MRVRRDSLAEVGIRAVKIYVFIVALIFLGEGFKPLIVQYVVPIPSAGLYWVNIIQRCLTTQPSLLPRLTLSFQTPDKKCPHGPYNCRGDADTGKYPEYHFCGKNRDYE